MPLPSPVAPWQTAQLSRNTRSPADGSGDCPEAAAASPSPRAPEASRASAPGRANAGYSRTVSWPTTCAGCNWHLIGKTPALSAVKVTVAVLSPATTSFTPNAAIS